METNLRKRTSGLVARDVDGEILILDTVSDRVHQLNQSASLIWRCIERELSPQDTAKELAEAFGLGSDQAQRDVNDAISQLKALNLIA